MIILLMLKVIPIAVIPTQLYLFNKARNDRINFIPIIILTPIIVSLLASLFFPIVPFGPYSCTILCFATLIAGIW